MVEAKTKTKKKAQVRSSSAKTSPQTTKASSVAKAMKGKLRGKKKEPKTMEDLLDLYGNNVKSLKQGDEVGGVIVSISDTRVVVDIGGKSEGIVAEKAFKEAKEYIKSLEVGQELTFGVIIPETYDGFTILSLRKASQEASWGALQKSFKSKKPIKVNGRSVNQAGVMVSVEGLAGFIPLSQLGIEASKNPNSLINSTFEVIPVEIIQEENKVVLSERMVSDVEIIELIEKAMKKIKEGEIYEGKVVGLASFGCFVAIMVKVGKEEVSVDGLVHLSELSWEKVTSTADEVSEGDKVKVKVIGKDGGKLSLSMKQAAKDPWDDAASKYANDTKVKGKIMKSGEYGVFVQLEPGIEGLVHMTKIPPGEKMDKGREVEVYIEEIDTKEKKISLGLVLTQAPIGYK